MDRRKFVTKAMFSGAAVSLTPTLAAAGQAGKVRIIGVSCSPRKGKTTATSVKVALEAAKEVDSRIQVELLDLGHYLLRKTLELGTQLG